VSNTQHVLNSLSSTRSGIDPPTSTTASSRARLDRSAVDGEASPSMSSAYTGKESLAYGQFHISGSTTCVAPTQREVHARVKRHGMALALKPTRVLGYQLSSL
jgi:hypothetical protein